MILDRSILNAEQLFDVDQVDQLAGKNKAEILDEAVKRGLIDPNLLVDDISTEKQLKRLADLGNSDDVYIGPNDLEAYVHTPGEGYSYSLTYRNIAVREEDLALVKSGDTLLTQEVHDMSFNQACREVIDSLGKYIDPTIIRLLFPGLNMRDYRSYDFRRNGRISTFVFNIDDFLQLQEAYKDDPVDSLSLGGYQTGELKVWQNPKPSDIGPYKLVNPHNRTIIVIPETSITEHFADVNDHKPPSKAYIYKRLVARFTHELLHAFLIQEEAETSMEREAIVEYLAARIYRRHRSGSDIVLGYSVGVLYVEKIEKIATSLGIKQDTLLRALVSGDPKSQQEIFIKFSSRYGDEIAQKLLRFKFNTMSDAYRYLYNSGSDNPTNRES